MKIQFDPDRCVGHAQCFTFGPEVYDLDEGGYCLLKHFEVPVELEDEAVAGAQACPEQAITIQP